ncbi:MAG: NUDIX domain-containing protein [Clostridia bacterium]|nr:NUDIX domain-containing protein [Clostridia bacterium]MBR5010553.1 NUDIX domain-containing protein [Clostridia bacterium]MBR5258429.1 NUDIX domain-containing protein [Clostridia bacterium]MBR5985173.1 NUDIX domain-containing protein [Clostridia bacterium]MBR6007845.1 NUDIX domain-containing protein [Clostridia bacterium]
MSIRCSAKALILDEGRLLLNKCVSHAGVYYTLPGGGMHDGEILTEAVKREVMEETGLTVTPMRLSCVFERVTQNAQGAVSAHKMYFVFLCRPDKDVPVREPAERDLYQVGMEWLTLRQASEAPLFPRVIRDNLPALIDYGETLFLGSEKRGGGFENSGN